MGLRFDSPDQSDCRLLGQHVQISWGVAVRPAGRPISVSSMGVGVSRHWAAAGRCSGPRSFAPTGCSVSDSPSSGELVDPGRVRGQQGAAAAAMGTGQPPYPPVAHGQPRQIHHGGYHRRLRPHAGRAVTRDVLSALAAAYTSKIPSRYRVTTRRTPCVPRRHFPPATRPLFHSPGLRMISYALPVYIQAYRPTARREHQSSSSSSAAAAVAPAPASFGAAMLLTDAAGADAALARAEAGTS